VHIFAFISPILFVCGTYPNPGSATSPFVARAVARPFPPGRNHARRLDCCRLPLVSNNEALPAIRDFQGLPIAPASWWAASWGGALMGEMRRANAREEEERRKQDRFASTIVIAASIIAAVRLAREPDISRPSPRLTSVVADNPQFDDASDFADGLAAVHIGDYKTGKSSYIDKTGHFVINPQFEHASNFSEGLAAVQIGDAMTGKWGFIDRTGHLVINPQFDDALNFAEGLARVCIGVNARECGYLDKAGRYVINPQFEYACNFSGGLAAVRIGGKWGYIAR
jgi:hypothetical protein